MNEFPRKSNRDAVLRLTEALRREMAGDDIGARHRQTAQRWGVLAGFMCRTVRAEENLGAFLCDVQLSGHVPTADELALAFAPWVQGDDGEGATLTEYGFDHVGLAEVWLRARFDALAVVLAGADPGDVEPLPHSDAGVLENPPQRLI
jgi:hypothetical protein